MNWKLIFLPIAVPLEIAAAVVTDGKYGFFGFGDWVMDRKLGDPNGKWHQTRGQALADQRKNAK